MKSRMSPNNKLCTSIYRQRRRSRENLEYLPFQKEKDSASRSHQRSVVASELRVVVYSSTLRDCTAERERERDVDGG